ncbi:uncharacterized protein [Dysidea avara]|uniref:uncharacterized protein isoform X2 n=1 Tax=Dysidea avara TaxID=196820 RepID=UPI0033291D3E
MDENNKTPMELAVDRGHSGIVYYFFKESDMDTSQFDEETKKKISLMISQEIGQGNSNPEAMPSASTDHLSIDDVNKAYMDAEMMGSDVRIALLGAEGSGKTCLSHTLVGKTFQDTLPTEGADHMEIIVENTTNWQPITDEEKLDDLEQQKCLEAMFLSATKPAKSQQSISVAPAIAPTSSSVPVSSTSFLYPSSGSSQGSTIVSEKMPPTKKQRLSVTGVLKYAQNKKGLHISVKKFKNLKAIREQYNPTKKYINIWDFAGQAVFQHTHGMFVSEEVVCVIVFDASLGLDKKPARRYSNDRTPRRTVLQTICYWMELISSRVSKPSTSDSDLSLFLPTFILVATHIDKLDFGRYVGCDLAYENFLTVLKKELVGKPFSKHIAGSKQGQLFEKGSPSLFFICNKQLARNPTDINELKKVVIQAASITRYCRPTRYVEFERKLMLLSIQEKLYVIGLAELAEVAESCGLPTDQKELLKLAKYFHHKGSLLYFPEVPSLSDTIILSPHWLAKLLTYVLTSLTCLPIEPHLVAFARRRQKEGLLEEELIHWSVEQFNKSEAPGNRIATDLRGVPVVELFIKFQLIVDITQSSLAGSRLRGEQDRLFLVPHLLPFEELSPSVEQSFKFLFYFPAHFIPDNLVDQLIVKCAHWNHDRQYDLTKLLYQWAVLELGDYQTYQVKPNNEQCYIELTIIPDRAMPSEYEEKSYNESKELITTVKGFIDDLMKEHMAATYEKSPVECFVPCPVQTCNELHISLQNSRFVRTGSAYCCVKGDHCHLPKYAKILSSKGSPTQSTGVNTVPQKTSSLSPDQALGGDPTQSTQDNTTFEQVASPLTLDRRPKMWPLKKIVIPKIAADWKDVADCLDFDINTIRIIESKHTNDCVKSCEELLRDWLSTNHGKKPKTWTTLLETLHEIDQLATAANDIENELQELMKK